VSQALTSRPLTTGTVQVSVVHDAAGPVTDEAEAVDKFAVAEIE